MLLLLLLSHFSPVRLCVDPTDVSPPGSPTPGILQARTLEWAAISFSAYSHYCKAIISQLKTTTTNLYLVHPQYHEVLSA